MNGKQTMRHLLRSCASGNGKRAMSPRSSSKYGAVRTTVEGKAFASKREAARYCVLALLARQGHIKNLVCQVRYPLTVNGQLVCTYVADFCYQDIGGEQIIEDCKGFRTPIYRLKSKLFTAVTGKVILES